MPPVADLVLFALALVAAGVVSGLLAGIFGIGGGGIIVPVLYEALGILGFEDSSRMHVAIGTAVAITAPTTVRSFLAHRQRGAVDAEFLKSWLIAVPLGVAIATMLAASVSGEELRLIFAIITLFVGLRLVFNRQSWRIGGDVPKGPGRWAAGIGIGFVSALMGIGGGILTNTYMTLYGRPIHQAIATSSGVGVLILIPGVIGYVIAGWGAPDLPPFSLGYVNLLCFAIVMPLALAVAKLGVGVAHNLSKRKLEVGFGLFVLFVSSRFFWSVWFG